MLYFLAGITASGKSNLAHKIAIERNMSILSIDSMAVYKGLDILTAKPTDVMQAQVQYYGLDIADPDQNFSIIDYLNYLIEEEIPEKSPFSRVVDYRRGMPSKPACRFASARLRRESVDCGVISGMIVS